MKSYTINYSTKNGLGRPSINLFLSGCDKPEKCKGCHNEGYHLPYEGEIEMSNLIKQLDKNIHDFMNFHSLLHVSILGGEPLTNKNREVTLAVSKYIKGHYPDAQISIYTWRNLETVLEEPFVNYLKYIDFGVLGSYEENLKVSHYLPSSTNQVIYDFQQKKCLPAIKLAE